VTDQVSGHPSNVDVAGHPPAGRPVSTGDMDE
jgi:hypothetical protein